MLPLVRAARLEVKQATPDIPMRTAPTAGACRPVTVLAQPHKRFPNPLEFSRLPQGEFAFARNR